MLKTIGEELGAAKGGLVSMDCDKEGMCIGQFMRIKVGIEDGLGSDDGTQCSFGEMEEEDHGWKVQAPKFAMEFAAKGDAPPAGMDAGEELGVDPLDPNMEKEILFGPI
ncbi:hypothetical protein ACFXTH_031840 [Malus domestica]